MSGRKRRDRPRTMDELLRQGLPTPSVDIPATHETPLPSLSLSQNQPFTQGSTRLTPAPTQFGSSPSTAVRPSPSAASASVSQPTGSTTMSTSSSRGRGPAKGIPSWNSGTPYDVQFDNTLHPVGPGARQFISQLGHMVRDPHRFPLTMLDWAAFPQDTLDRLWGEVKDNLRSCPDKFRPVCMSKCRNLWKDHKNKVKRDHWKKNIDAPDLLQRVPRCVLPTQWPELVRYWSSEEARQEAERNSQNRSMQGPSHRLGTRHITQVRHQLREEGALIDRMSVWIASRRLDDPEVAALVAQFEAQLAQLPEEERQVAARRDEIFHAIIGRDGHGYTLTYGSGIPRSIIAQTESIGRSSSQSSRLRTDEEVDELIQSLRQEMETRVENIQARMEVQMQAQVQVQVQQLQAQLAELENRIAQARVPIVDGSDPPIRTQAPDAGSGHQARRESVGEGIQDAAGSNDQDQVD